METERQKIEIWFDSYEEIRDKAKLFDELMANYPKEDRSKMIMIPKWQMDRIEDTLRVTSNIHHSQNRVTCHDRMVCRAWKFSRESMGLEYDNFEQGGLL